MTRPLLPLALALALGPAAALGQTEDTEKYWDDLSLDELLEAPVHVASGVPQRREQAPAITSVITREDIEQMGARDMTDVLRLVPGFEFGMDAIGGIGASFRGIWAFEGKMLVMVNGVPWNELGFGLTNQFGSLPASIVSKVEVLRGPGSAVFGDFAGVAVINVITHEGASLNGLRASASGGLMSGGELARQVNLSAGTKVGELELAAHVGANFTPLSGRTYRDFYGNSLRMGGANSGRDWSHILLEARGKGLTLNYNHTTLEYLGQDGYSVVIPRVNGINQEHATNTVDALQLGYRLQLGKHLSLEPGVQYVRGNNNYTMALPSSVAAFGFTHTSNVLQRMKAEVALAYEEATFGILRGGAGYVLNTAHNVGRDGQPGLQYSADPEDVGFDATTHQRYAFAQFIRQFGDFGVTAGGRYEHTTFGDAFAPRVGLTWAGERLNAKLLYGQSFRIPTAWQQYSRFLMPYDPEDYARLRPEHARTVEAELGFKAVSNVAARVNAFFVTVDDALMYNGVTNTYQNLGTAQSMGAEGEVVASFGDFGGFVNGSLALPRGRTHERLLASDGRSFLGTPSVKLNAGGHYTWGKLRFSPSATFLGPRAGQTAASARAMVDENGVPTGAQVFASSPSQALLLLNAAVTAREVLPGLDVSLSAHNLLDAQYVLIQPFYGSHAPLPANDRQVTLGLTYSL
jgi:hypothetical protein